MPSLGCIADDFTGSTDLAGMLVKHGMRTVQMIGVPQAESCPTDVDAVVVALKSRTNPAFEAVQESLAALRWLQEARCQQFYFKYCSTFDSTPQGNIGPVAEALMDALCTDFTIACPAFPANRRTIYQGYLFVDDVLLNESAEAKKTRTIYFKKAFMASIRMPASPCRARTSAIRCPLSLLLWFTTAAQEHAVPFCWQPPQARGRD
jgi:uncharacterized protein YgbK (DUF1537 family)